MVDEAERFRRWCERRRAAGLCIQCPEKSQPGRLRCPSHAEVNRARRERWKAEHPDYAHVMWDRAKERVAAGICLCKERRPLTDGFRRCEECRERQRANSARSRNRRKG